MTADRVQRPVAGLAHIYGQSCPAPHRRQWVLHALVIRRGGEKKALAGSPVTRGHAPGSEGALSKQERTKSWTTGSASASGVQMIRLPPARHGPADLPSRRQIPNRFSNRLPPRSPARSAGTKRLKVPRSRPPSMYQVSSLLQATSKYCQAFFGPPGSASHRSTRHMPA